MRALLNTRNSHNADSLGWDARREEVISIKLSRRLLATALVGVALVISAIMVASLKGDDKPTINVETPPADEEPQEDAQVNPTPDIQDLPDTSDDDQNTDDDEEQDDPDDPELPDDDEDDPEDDDKATGLGRAIQAHVRNMEKMEQKGKSTPPGLQHSLELLTQMYNDLLSGDEGDADDSDPVDHPDNGKHNGNANGHNQST